MCLLSIANNFAKHKSIALDILFIYPYYPFMKGQLCCRCSMSSRADR